MLPAFIKHNPQPLSRPPAAGGSAKSTGKNRKRPLLPLQPKASGNSPKTTPGRHGETSSERGTSVQTREKSLPSETSSSGATPDPLLLTPPGPSPSSSATVDAETPSRISTECPTPIPVELSRYVSVHCQKT